MKSEMKALKSQGWVYGRLTGCGGEAGMCVLLSFNRLKELCVLSEKKPVRNAFWKVKRFHMVCVWGVGGGGEGG